MDNFVILVPHGAVVQGLCFVSSDFLCFWLDPSLHFKEAVQSVLFLQF